MKLKEMLKGALLQLGYETDDATVEKWRDKLTRYLNDAMIDLTGELQPRRTDRLTLTNGMLDLSLLPRSVVKAIAIMSGNTRLPFYYGSDTNKMRVPATDDGDVFVTYRYMPDPLKKDDDVPEFPEWVHSTMVSYAVGRVLATGDEHYRMNITAARAAFEVYTAAKRMMRANRGELDAYSQFGDNA